MVLAPREQRSPSPIWAAQQRPTLVAAFPQPAFSPPVCFLWPGLGVAARPAVGPAAGPATPRPGHRKHTGGENAGWGNAATSVGRCCAAQMGDGDRCSRGARTTRPRCWTSDAAAVLLVSGRWFEGPGSQGSEVCYWPSGKGRTRWWPAGPGGEAAGEAESAGSELSRRNLIRRRGFGKQSKEDQGARRPSFSVRDLRTSRTRVRV